MKTKRVGIAVTIILLAFTFTVAAEGNPWFGFVPYMATGGPCCNKKPIAALKVDTTSGVVPLKVSFDASNSYDPDGEIVSYKWKFGDNSTSSVEKVDHTYEDPGIYNAVLTVVDDDGEKDTDSVEIEVKAPPKSPVAKIKANPTSGQVPLKVHFDGTDSYDPDGKIVNYHWKFGDGHTDKGKNVNHTYQSVGTYKAKLTVKDNEGKQDTAEVTIKVKSKPTPNRPPVAKIVSPDHGDQFKVGEDISFEACNSYDPDGEIVSYEWKFGDGSTSSKKNTSHSYDEAGTYEVCLKVKDDDGATDRECIKIKIIREKRKPVAKVKANPISGRVPLVVRFDGSDSYDPDGKIVSYDWEFGNGRTGQGKKIGYAYLKPGTYTAVLTVTDNDGLKDQDKVTVRVKERETNKPPVAKIDSPNDNSEFKVNTSITFSGDSSCDPDGYITKWKWHFNDGTTKYGETVNHSFSSPGEYNAVLTVTDDKGAKISDSIQVNIVVPIKKEAVLSLNKENKVYCSEGGNTNVPLILEGWGNEVKVLILYDPKVVQSGGIYPRGNWIIESIEHSCCGRIEATFTNDLTREDRDRATRVANLNFHCNLVSYQEDLTLNCEPSPKETTLDLKTATIYSEGDNVNILALIDTKIVVQ